MELLPQLAWRAPWWGLLALVPLLLAGLTWQRRHRLLGYAEAALRPWAMTTAASRPGERWWRAGHWLLWLLLALAAAGPRLPLEAPEDGGDGTPRHVMDLYVLLDLSASMAAADIAPSRLERARLELRDLLERLAGERIGLIVYAGQAGLLSPLSDDPAVFARALDLARPDLLERPGSDLAAALSLAQQALDGRSRQGAILLVSDAEADSLAGAAGARARQAADRLAGAGIPLYVLGVASLAGAPVPLPDGGYAERDGAQVLSRLAEASYTGLARATGGGYAAVADGDSDWRALYDGGIARLAGAPLPPERVRAWRELYPWCLAPALALLLLLHLPVPRRAGSRHALALITSLVVLSGLPPAPVHAADSPGSSAWSAAWQDFQAGRYAQAQMGYARLGGYAGHMGAGAAAWQLRDYSAAARYFASALLLAGNRQDSLAALYNLGNAHYGLADWRAAVEAYQAVLRERPSDARAQANLEQALTRLMKQRAADPMRSDLKARRGSIAEGEVNIDWDRELAVEAFAAEPDQPLLDRSARPVAGARLAGKPGAESRAEADARRLASGLKKMELLDDRPIPLLRGLLKQDAADAPAGDLPPW